MWVVQELHYVFIPRMCRLLSVAHWSNLWRLFVSAHTVAFSRGFKLSTDWSVCLQHPVHPSCWQKPGAIPEKHLWGARANEQELSNYPGSHHSFPLVLYYHSQRTVSDLFLPTILTANPLFIFLFEGKWIWWGERGGGCHSKFKHLHMWWIIKTIEKY